MNLGFTKLLAITLVGISLFAGFYIWRLQTARGLDLVLEVPEEIMSGAPFDLKINFSNNSGGILNDARMTIVLPEGAAFFGSSASKTIENRQLGNIGQGSLVQEDFKIIMSVPEPADKIIKVTVNYAPASLGARFEKTAQAKISVRSSGVAIEMSAPSEVTSGEEFETAIVYRNISDADFSDLELKMEYPASFSFTGASLKPDSENNLWKLGDLRKNSEGKIIIKGNVTGSEKDTYEFKSKISQRAAGEDYLVSSGSVKTSVSASPLSLSINLNGNSEYVAKAGEVLNYALSYANGTEIPLRNVLIKAKLSGEMFDFSTLSAQGALRQGENTLIWNSSGVPNLEMLSPGNAGAANFSVKVRENFPIKRFSDKNYSLLVNAEIVSPTILPSTSASLLTKSRLENKVAGAIGIDAKAYFRDAESGFLNSGVFPPKAGQPTQFTIHWILRSMAADVSGVEVRSILGNNVRMIGEARSNSGSAPSYNPETNEVFWQVDKLQANQGVIGSPIEAVFQIEATPNASNIGAYLPLINATTIRATDVFTGQELINNDVGITTALPDDATVSGQGGMVQP